jgi:hypothetical protein
MEEGLTWYANQTVKASERVTCYYVIACEPGSVLSDAGWGFRFNLATVAAFPNIGE